jgi:hypothetical protein
MRGKKVAMHDTEVVEKDTQKPQRLQIELTKLLTDINSQEAKTDRDFLKLGVMLDQVRGRKLWSDWGYEGYNAFIKSLAEKYQYAGRTKLYNCARIAEQLLEVADPADVEQMGISKASKLSSAIKKADGKKPSDSLLQAAKDINVTAAQLDTAIASEYEFKNEFESGTWVDLSGCFMNEAEREEWERAIRVACQDDPPIQLLDRWNDNKAAHLRKEILWRWTASYLAEKEPDVLKKQSNVPDRPQDEDAFENI